MRKSGRKWRGRGGRERRRNEREGGKEGEKERKRELGVCTYCSWVRVGEEGYVSNHLLVGKLIILCALDHSIQHQHTAKCFAIWQERRGRRGRRKRRG